VQSFSPGSHDHASNLFDPVYYRFFLRLRDVRWWRALLLKSTLDSSETIYLCWDLKVVQACAVVLQVGSLIAAFAPRLVNIVSIEIRTDTGSELLQIQRGLTGRGKPDDARLTLDWLSTNKS
jgi:hypothetical protein